MRQLILVLSLCLLGVLPAQAAVFTEDFEVTAGVVNVGGTATDLAARGWTITCSSTPCTSEIVSRTGRTGTTSKMLRQKYINLTGDLDEANNSKITQLFSPGLTDFFERYWAYYEPIDSSKPSSFGPPTASLNGGAKDHYFNHATYPNYYSMLGQGGGSKFSLVNQKSTASPCPAGNSSVTCNLVSNQAAVNLTQNVWHCLETHIGPSIVEQWADGVKVTSYSTGISSPANVNSVQIYRQVAQNLYRYEDDFVVATTRVGCSGTLPTGDTTPPSPPSNLVVQ